MDPLIARLDQLVFEELDAALIAPTHGLPITDPEATLPAIREGLRLGSGIVAERPCTRGMTRTDGDTT